MKKGLPSVPLPASKVSSQTPSDSSREVDSGVQSDGEFTEDFSSSDSTVTSWTSTPDKNLVKVLRFYRSFLLLL